MNFPPPLYAQAEALLAQAAARRFRIATAESCTGGLIAALLTEIPGASRVVGRSFITYSNRAKREVLNVPQDILTTHGAVSEATVRAMAENLLAQTSAHLTIAVSGVAGPDGGSAEKPVGTVHMASASAQSTTHKEHRFGAIGRAEVRAASVAAAIEMLAAHLTAI